MKKDSTSLIVLVVLFIVLDLIGTAIMNTTVVEPRGPSIILPAYFAFLVAQVTLLAMWWAIGLSPYWGRLFGTAAAIVIGCGVLILMARRGRLDSMLALQSTIGPVVLMVVIGGSLL